MIDMAKTPEEIEEDSSPVLTGEQEKYPYGLRIYLTHDELEKLGVDYSDWEIGETFHLFAFAKVTSISKNSTVDGENCNISLQITHLAGESEDAENQEYEEAESDEPPLDKHGYLRYK